MPYVVRLLAGLARPKTRARMLGADMAGVVETVGKNVTGFRAGDEMFGGLEGRGTLAECITIGEAAAVLPKPASLTFEQAAAVPVAAFTALQALRDKGHIEPGHGAQGADQRRGWRSGHVRGPDSQSAGRRGNRRVQ
ncbi:MAG: alcohol dehydrogenase catalytic domain-containing protein [Streptosporangiaceae bacterium]